MTDTCQRGHLWSENTYIDPRGKRQCAECRREANRRWIAVHPGKGGKGKHHPTFEESVRSKFSTGPASECWPWTGHITDEGYGRHRARPAHRVVYELLVGPVPPELTLDHLCRNRACVNPAHLEPVTASVNTRRGIAVSPTWRSRLASLKLGKTHCPQGHPYSGDNLVLDSTSGARRCRTCEIAKFHRYQARVRARRDA